MHGNALAIKNATTKDSEQLMHCYSIYVTTILIIQLATYVHLKYFGVKCNTFCLSWTEKQSSQLYYVHKAIAIVSYIYGVLLLYRS